MARDNIFLNICVAEKWSEHKDSLVLKLVELPPAEWMNVFQKPLVAGLNAIQLAVLMNDTSIMENLECVFEHDDLRRLLSDELRNGRRLLHYAIKYDHHTLVSTVLDHNYPESTPEPLSPHDFSVLVSFALIHGSNAQTKSAIVASKHVDLSKAGLHPDKNNYHDLL